MKIIKPIILIAGLAIALGSTANAQGSGAGIVGSPHDFTDNVGMASGLEVGVGGWNAREEVCRVCHVPHDHNRAQAYGDAGLLWNHALSTATYTLYTSDTMDVTATQPTGFSKMCLGCHDGTVGVDTFDRYTGGTVFIGDYNDGFQVPGALFAGTLANTHPISIVYDPALDPGLQPVTALMGGSGTIDDVLEGGVLQCSSCHDVHDQPGESVAGTHLLRVNQKASTGTASGLCLTCHIK